MNCDLRVDRARGLRSLPVEADEGTVLEVEGPEFARLALELLRRGASIRFRARGSSMSPAIGDGDVLTVTPCNPEGLRLGDMALYRNAAGSLFAHRVLGRRLGVRAPALEMRGDASRGQRETVPAEAVLGRVVSANRGGVHVSVAGAASRWLALCRICLTPLPLLRLGGALRRRLSGER